MYPVRLLLWNLGRRSRATTDEGRAPWREQASRRDYALASLVKQRQANIVICVEDHRSRCERRRWLQEEVVGDWRVSPIDNSIGLHVDLPGAVIVPLADAPGRYSVVALHFGDGQELILAAAHLPARPWTSEIGQDEACQDLAEAIRQAEQRRGHRQTVLAGDLNVQPYERGVVRERALRAVMDRRIADRARAAQASPFFYNPMWSHYGDRSLGPAGTYYSSGGGHLATYWYMLDQVLLRPELLDRASGFSLEIVETAGSLALYREGAGLINSSVSDHLPVYCEFAIPRGRGVVR